MSEELLQRGMTLHGLVLGDYEYYNIGSVTLNQLKQHKIIASRDYGEYGLGKPDGLLVDRRNKSSIKVIAVIEHKDQGKFNTDDDKVSAIRQCNNLAQVLGAKLGIATDNTSYTWFNPDQPDEGNDYVDKFGVSRSFSIVRTEEGAPLVEPFTVTQKDDAADISMLNDDTLKSIELLMRVIEVVSPENSSLSKPATVDPSNLAKQIWQDVWSVSGATPERCLYTFVELFIFKYLSDLGILEEDDRGNKVNFDHIITLDPAKAFKNYSENARRWLKQMFPANPEDNTTIINGTVLNPNVPEHASVFFKILKKLESFGALKNIDPSFKSKVFEDFMKESISKKNWGQYFTPRNIIDAVIEMSDIDKLEEGSEVCDPACGVGGFLLEPIKMRPEGSKFYYTVNGRTLTERLNFTGYDKGFEKEEQLTIILAKANMLIFLSDLLKDHPTLAGEFARVFNSTFKLLSNTILGTIALTDKDKYDLILTNPPYVTSGSSNYKEAIKADSNLQSFYKVQGMGVEGLFMEWIVRSLKPGKKAFIIIPDGILNRLNDKKLRAFIVEQCYLDGIISLPINAFYTTPKKTYILAITKKDGKTDIDRSKQLQTSPVFTYLASNIGETLDVNRFPTDENDLPEAVALFNQFKGAKDAFSSPSQRCKIQPFDRFDPEESWTVDRWWSEEEKIELGIEDEKLVLSIEEFLGEVELTKSKIDEMISGFKKIESMNDEVPDS